ncbi:hypothetical protein VH571_12795 [Frondihabitans sp. 4ASC-45]|uniref:hypothetical protein n=1 Tax=Frondihabitans sp. 4ASC-45 TaxID=3111636 RepID=UPI003C1B3AB5
MPQTPIAASLAGLALLATLTGCTTSAPTAADIPASTSSPTGPTSTARTTPPATATPEVELPSNINTCVDGQALINTTQKTASLPDGCDTVFVQTEDATIDLGPTKKLVFEGHGNTVTYTGEAPEIIEAGESVGTNSAVAK